LIAGHPDPSYFGRTLETMPTFVVTTGAPLGMYTFAHFCHSFLICIYIIYIIEDSFKEGKAPFNTFSIHRFLDNGESVIKIFSAKRLDESFLDTLFLNRSWTYHKGWHAFPELYPVTKESDFASCILKTHKHDSSGIIYTGAFENFISVSPKWFV
jgi:prenylcysteine oxidase/farnesylcysteine lyase